MASPSSTTKPYKGHTYRALFRINLMESFAYRTQNVVWVLVGAAPTLFAIAAWLAVYGTGKKVGDFTRGDIITYYLVVGLAWYVIGGRINMQIARAIKDGTLAQRLLKPFVALAEWVIAEQTWKLVSLGLALPVYAAVVFFFRDDLHLNLTVARTLLAILATVLAASLFIVLEVILGITAFWSTDTRHTFELYDIILVLASGELVPLALCPSWLFAVLTAAPFRYTFSFPVEVLLNKIGPGGIAAGFALQIGWLVVLVLLARLLWSRGLRRYSAAGL